VVVVVVVVVVVEWRWLEQFTEHAWLLTLQLLVRHCALYKCSQSSSSRFQTHTRSLFLDVVACACTESTSKAMERRQSAAWVTDPTRLLARTVLWNRLHGTPIHALVLANASFVCVAPPPFVNSDSVKLCSTLLYIVPLSYTLFFIRARTCSSTAFCQQRRDCEQCP